MKKLLSILLVILLAYGCAPQKGAINFEKIFFHTSRCFGYCPIYHLQVNKDQTLLLSKEETLRNAKQSAMTQGPTTIEYFKGSVNNADFKILLNELAKTDTLDIKGETCCDGSLKTIIAFYSGKRRVVQTMFPPKEGENLIAILMKICQSQNLVKTEKFELEESAPPELDADKK